MTMQWGAHTHCGNRLKGEWTKVVNDSRWWATIDCNISLC